LTSNFISFRLISWTDIISCREPRKENEETDISVFTSFLEEVKLDYQNASQTLRTSLNKFKDRYNAAKSKSIPRLSSFLYDINRNFDPTACLKSGPMIPVQVEFIKRRKTEKSGGRKRKLPAIVNEEKENFDPQAVPARKKKKTGKKDHNLSMHIAKNQPN
jgi:hypothetical protein